MSVRSLEHDLSHDSQEGTMRILKILAFGVMAASIFVASTTQAKTIDDAVNARLSPEQHNLWDETKSSYMIRYFNTDNTPFTQNTGPVFDALWRIDDICIYTVVNGIWKGRVSTAKEAGQLRFDCIKEKMLARHDDVLNSILVREISSVPQGQ